MATPALRQEGSFATRRVETIDLASMSVGTARSLKVFRYGAIDARPKVYIQAALHADELPGMLAAHHLIAALDEADRRGEILGQIILVPVANPIGLDQNVGGAHVGYRDLRSGGDFNRQWPDLSEGLADAVAASLTQDPAHNREVILAALQKKLESWPDTTERDDLRANLAGLAFDADIVLDLHCDDEALLHVYTMPQHWPQAADLTAELEAAACLLCDDSGGNCFDETFSLPWTRLQKHFAGRLPIPAACFSATVELRGQAAVFDDLALKDAAGLLRFLRRRNIVAGSPPDSERPSCAGTALDAMDVVAAPAAGIVAYHVALGDRVEQGQVVAEIVNPLADDPAAARIAMRAATAGVVISRCIKKLAAPGDGILMIVGQQALAYRQVKLMTD